MIILSETIRMKIRDLVWEILPEIQEYTSKRLMRFESKKLFQTGTQVYKRNDWTTARVMEIDCFLASKFNIALEK